MCFFRVCCLAVGPVPEDARAAFAVWVIDPAQTSAMGMTRKFGDVIVDEQGVTQMRQHKNGFLLARWRVRTEQMLERK